MKRMRVIFACCIVSALLSACGEAAESGKNDIVPIESVKMDEEAGGEESDSLPPQGENAEPAASDGGTGVPSGEGDAVSSEAGTEAYVGEYDSTELSDYKLEIGRNPDGSYRVQIHIFRLTRLYDCIGYDAEGGITFSTAEWGKDKEISGFISLEGDTAAVIFTGGWSAYSFGNINEYQYVKSSDTPVLGERPEVNLGSYAGVYNDYDNHEPNLEISQNEDGSYSIQIGIFRLLSLEDAVGQETGGEIHFSSDDRGLEGTVTLEGDVATVTFMGDFPYSDIRMYRYYKVSDET